MFKKVAFLTTVILVLLSLRDDTVRAEGYIVKPGDTLLKISDEYGLSVDTIVNLNRLQSTILEPGQYVELPDIYRVMVGDTLYKISMKLEVSLSELKEANPAMQNQRWIYPGQIIHVPINNGMVFMGDSSEKRIALTFDDGPENTYTPQILEILRQENVKATFFVVGERVREYPEQLRRMYKDGHAIGNHTWNHPHLSKVKDKEFIENIRSTSEEIERVIGVKPNLFRPPYGEIKDHQLEWLQQQGYQSIMWTADTKDWSGVSAEDIVSKVKQEANPGVIVLQHNYHATGPFETVQALSVMIGELREQGYQFVTVPELLGD
ncbi:polysaccharide deacetylase family protein [Oceanobacillus senegalensis]|uniref:polysaccharide deacetylase family protein n=1 Tax=Oceanobacillus senegalensis TaxID=1936063 RepID=UPI000A30CE43|nr:polysaccharide deacetylase family protein [Oceanobacillus senegalensis]